MHSIVWTLLAVAGLSACSAERSGGITATLVFDGDAPGSSRHELRALAPPPEIDRLLITAFDTKGATLAHATLVSGGSGADRLLREGGTWRLDNVPVGADRILVIRAYYGTRAADPRTHGQEAFSATRNNITVISKGVTDLGVVVLERNEGVRVARLDFEPPSSPGALRVVSIPEGNALHVAFNRPDDSDNAGYIVAIAPTSPSVPETPILGRGFSVVGDSIAPGVTIAARSREPELTISSLSNGVVYRVYVYAYDTDFDGQPLNYSSPSIRDAIAADTSLPGSPADLTVTASATRDRARISFLSPGDDGESGLAEQYQVRIAGARELLASSFESARSIQAPPRVPGGERVDFEREFAELAVSPTDPFFVGVRAVDEAGNKGPVVIGAYAPAATIEPRIAGFEPAFGLADSELSVRGILFGEQRGTVALTTDANGAAVALQVLSWRNDLVRVRLPADAQSGVLQVQRADRAGSGSSYLSVLRDLGDPIDSAVGPFALIGVNGGTAAALHIARDRGSNHESLVERIFGLAPEGLGYMPLSTRGGLTAVSGVYLSQLDRFVFVASSSSDPVSAALISTSTSTPDERRIRDIASYSGADGIGISLSESSPGTVPAVLAVSEGGAVHIGTTVDLLTRRFSTFETVTATSSHATHATLARRRLGDSYQYVLAYQEGAEGRETLALQVATGAEDAPGPWSRLGGVTAPRIADRIRIVDLPGSGFVVAYEQSDANGLTDVRLLRLTDFGSGPGLAPLAPTSTGRRLEDVGLVTREGRPWFAVAFSDSATGNLSYAEVDPSGLAVDARVQAPARELALAMLVDGEPRPTARLGCREPAVQCPLVWLGPGTSALFMRR